MADANPTFTTAFVASLREHLRIVGNDDDVLLGIYSLAVWEHIRELTAFDWETATEDAPSALYAASLLLAADLFEHRTAQVADALYENKAAQMLIYPHRVWQ
jgi:hypothetical protein